MGPTTCRPAEFPASTRPDASGYVVGPDSAESGSRATDRYCASVARSGSVDQDLMFDWLDETSGRSAAVIVPYLLDLLSPTSVVDVGCGNGAWSRAFLDVGISDVVALDGRPADVSRLRIPENLHETIDLARPLDLGRRFDLALCLEVAEHLPESCASTLVASLVVAADVIVFSAAIPGQGGEGHVNEQWPDSWAELFAGHGYVPVDALRARYWHDDEVAWWYRQNAYLYVSGETEVPTWASEIGSGFSFPPDVVHPGLLAQQLRRSDLSSQSLKSLLAAVPRGALSAARRRSGWGSRA